LSTLADWQWFVTMTLRDPAGHGTWTKPGWASAKRAWVEFVNRARPALGDLTWVRMFEMTRDRGVPHIHALVANTDATVRRMDMVDWAWRWWGITRVLEYNHELGARFYLCKYITKDVADIEFAGLDKPYTKC
jgi:hypothetical protein